MSQTYDPNSPENGPEHGQGYASGPGWAGYASVPPPPPRRNHKRGLIVTGAVALAAGAAAGGLIGSWHGLLASEVTAAPRAPALPRPAAPARQPDRAAGGPRAGRHRVHARQSGRERGGHRHRVDLQRRGADQ